MGFVVLVCCIDYRYDFSADFPKLWGMSRLRGSHSEKEVRQKQQWRRSAANKTAKAYMRCIASWQVKSSPTERSVEVVVEGYQE